MDKRLVFVMVIGALVFLAGCADDSATGAATSGSGSAASVSGVMRIPLDEVSGDMERHSYDADGVDLGILVAEGSDGEPRTAFDACDVCGGHQGYRQEGGYAVCNNCGQRFAIDDIGTANQAGGCWPSYLEHEIDGDEIVIQKQDIYDNAYRFQ